MIKNILQIIPSIDSGGVEKCVLTMNKYLVNNGYNSFVMASGGKLLFQITNDGGKIIQLNVATKNPISMFLNIFRIKKVLIENKIDLVDVTSRAPAISTYFACKKAKIPFITSMHGNYSTGFLFKNWYNSFMSKGDFVVCVSNYIKQMALKRYNIFKQKYYNGMVEVVPRGVDEAIFDIEKVSSARKLNLLNKLNLPDDKQIMLLPGRFTNWKGQLYFLDVLKHVKNKNYVCVMIGDAKKHPRYKKRIEKKIKKLNLKDFIRFEAPTNDMTSFYSISSFIISSSIRGESFGMISIEAQAMEKIIIATAVGGSLETIIDKKTGYLVDPDDKKLFAKTIDKVLTMNLEEKNEICKNARRHILENFTINKMCENTLNVYKKFNTL
ncbi:MAG: glycosyltransferase [Rickettsiales bacterium]|jgi:glycosyltransferase involved in cell wall biosynthesis|nr:glycosyltransferase [Rickettsiales bacterium]